MLRRLGVLDALRALSVLVPGGGPENEIGIEADEGRGADLENGSENGLGSVADQ